VRQSQHDELQSEARRGRRPVAGWQLALRHGTRNGPGKGLIAVRPAANRGWSGGVSAWLPPSQLVSADVWPNDAAASSLLAAYVFFSSRFQYGRNQPACPIGAEMSCP